MALFYAYFRLSVHRQKPWNVQLDSPETLLLRAKPNILAELSYKTRRSFCGVAVKYLDFLSEMCYNDYT